MLCFFLELYKMERYDILGPCVLRTLQDVHLLLNAFFVSNLLVVNRYSVSQITRFSYIFKFAIIALNYVYYVSQITHFSHIFKFAIIAFVFDVATHTLVYLKYFSTQEIKCVCFN